MYIKLLNTAISFVQVRISASRLPAGPVVPKFKHKKKVTLMIPHAALCDAYPCRQTLLDMDCKRKKKSKSLPALLSLPLVETACG